jgi:hypothetical protein
LIQAGTGLQELVLLLFRLEKNMFSIILIPIWRDIYTKYSDLTTYINFGKGFFG